MSRREDKGHEFISFQAATILSANGLKGAVSALFPCIIKL